MDPIGAMYVKVPVERSLPTAEGTERKGLGDGHVDSGHSGLYPVAEFACGAARLRKDRRHVAKGQVVRLVDGILQGRGAGKRQHRPEDLFAPDSHGARDPVEDGGSEKEARPPHLTPSTDNKRAAPLRS